MSFSNVLLQCPPVAVGQDAYCRMPQSLDPIPFHFDHIIARKHAGPTESGNLAIACFGCNNQKQSDISGIDPDGAPDVPVRLFHPRKDVWRDHFAWDGLSLTAKTAVGRVTLYVLGINLAWHSIREASWRKQNKGSGLVVAALRLAVAAT